MFARRRQGAVPQPDASPGNYSRRPLSLPWQGSLNMQEALAVARPFEGSWVPEVRKESFDWASPVPRSSPGPNTSNSDGEFDLVIDESGPGTSAQLDADIPRRRAPQLDCEKPARSRSKYEVEQMLSSPGSLPKPLTACEREAAIRAMLPTATFQMMSQMSPQLLATTSEEAQTLRRKLARGATVVFISAGLPGKRFTFERAAELGIKSVVIDHHDSWSAGLVADGVIARFLPVDMTKRSDAVFEDVLQHLRSLSTDDEIGVVDGIATFVELMVPLVARLTEVLGLPGHRPEAVDAARDKYQTRACLKKAGLPTPKNALVRSTADVEAAGQHVGFPAVLKPISGAASLGVRKVTSMSELEQFYGEVVTELSSLVVTSGALVQSDGSQNQGLSAGDMVDLTVLLEQFLDGSEVDVDVVMSEGEWRYAGLADNGPTLEPYFNETWAVCPSLLPKDQQRSLKELAVGAVKALGFTSGVFHVECKATSTGPQLIEVNARMGGGQVRECNLRAWGVDLVEETIFAALGIPARPMVPSKPYTAVAYCYVNATESGTVQDVSALSELARRPGVVWAKPLTKVGDKVVGPKEGLPTWLCDLFVTGSDAKKALEFLQALEAESPVKVSRA